MMLPFGMSMVGGGCLHVAALLVLLIVAVTFALEPVVGSSAAIPLLETLCYALCHRP